MTFTPQQWPSDPGQQQAFIDNLSAGLDSVLALPEVLMFSSATFPTAAELINTWTTRYGALPPPDGARIAWYDTSRSRMENVFAAYSGVFVPLVAKDYSGNGIFYLGSSYNTASPGASLEVANIPATYRDLLILFTVRSTVVAATAPMYVRVNGAATAYYFEQFLVTGSGSPTFTCAEGLNQVGATLTVPAASVASLPQYATGRILIRDYAIGTRKPTAITWYDWYNGVDTAFIYTQTWFHNVVEAISTIGIYPGTATTVAKGSHLTVYGIK
jgi:hypothetical protein